MFSDKPIIIFDGNCQAQHLAAVFEGVGIAECYALGRDRGFLPSFRGVLTRYLEEDAAPTFVKWAKETGRTVIHASQSTPLASEQTYAFSPQVDHVVRFPHLQFLAMNPADTGIKIVTPEQLRRLYDMDLKTIERCQSRAGSTTDYAGIVRDKQRYAPLFHMTLHAGALLTSLQVQEIAKQIGRDADPAIVSAIHEISITEGINFVTHHPLSDSVLATLGFEWEGYELYRKMIGCLKGDQPTFILDNEDELRRRFGQETLFWQAFMRACINTGDFPRAGEAADELERRCPGSIMTWFTRIDFERRAGRGPDRVDEIMSAAAKRFGENRQFLHLRALVNLRIGRLEAGLEDAQAYFERADDLYDSIKPLLRSHLALGRVDEAERLLDAKMAKIQTTERRRLTAALGDLPQLASAASRYMSLHNEM